MHIYFSGVGGVAIGPLARIAKDLGYQVTGSDREKSRYTDSVEADGIEVIIGQSKESIGNVHQKNPIDWFVYTSGLPDDHPELEFAKNNELKVTKRDEFINHFLREKNLKMLAVAGTHGKTNTTGMLVWMFKELGIPISYSVGTNISYGPNGSYEEGSEYFIYEADEFDRNFLRFHPFASIFTSIDYDHPETYPTVEEYKKAFQQFAKMADSLITWRSVAEYIEIEDDYTRHIINDIPDGGKPEEDINLIGEYTRRNAFLALTLMKSVFPDVDRAKLLAALNSFPGTERRMEKLADNLYSDYGHHPIEIRAALEAALEINNSVVVVYQPHQNVRQHQVQNFYQDVFDRTKKTYWLPTYLSREQYNLPVLKPEELIAKLSTPEIAEPADMNDELIERINSHRQAGDMVLILCAGDLDAWARSAISR